MAMMKAENEKLKAKRSMLGILLIELKDAH